MVLSDSEDEGTLHSDVEFEEDASVNLPSQPSPPPSPQHVQGAVEEDERDQKFLSTYDSEGSGIDIAPPKARQLPNLAWDIVDQAAFNGMKAKPIYSTILAK